MLFFLPVSVKFIQCIIYSVRIVGISVISVIIIITVHIDIVIAIIVAVLITALFRTAGVFWFAARICTAGCPCLAAAVAARTFLIRVWISRCTVWTCAGWFCPGRLCVRSGRSFAVGFMKIAVAASRCTLIITAFQDTFVLGAFITDHTHQKENTDYHHNQNNCFTKRILSHRNLHSIARHACPDRFCLQDPLCLFRPQTSLSELKKNQ